MCRKASQVSYNVILTGTVIEIIVFAAERRALKGMKPSKCG